MRVRVAIVGAGSGYMPGVVRGLIHRAADLAGSELVFYDPHTEHVELIARLARRMFAAAGAELVVRTENELEAALDGAGFVFTTFRPGGLAARHLDESIPLRHGVLGQETAGPGGFLMACRSVPVLMRIAAALDEVSPGAWIVNYTNPTNIVTDAVTRYTGSNIVGLCDQHAGDQRMWADLLDLPAEKLEVGWVGLNHATWGERVRLDGRDASVEVHDRLDTLRPPDDADEATSQLVGIARTLRLLPNSYARYYFCHDEVVARLRARPTTRAQDIMAMMPRYYADLAREADRPSPDPSRERGGGEHGEFAVDVICAIAGDERRELIVNTPNRGAIAEFADDAIVEVPALVGAGGPRPLDMGHLPQQVRGLTMAIHSYERLAARAAATGDRQRALQALTVHPFVGSLPLAERILDEGMAAHRDRMPQFAGAGEPP